MWVKVLLGVGGDGGNDGGVVVAAVNVSGVRQT